jgi:Thrombospondin type 3 repeat
MGLSAFNSLWRFSIFAALAATAVTVALLAGALNSRAVQDPTIALDMVTTGNTYDDATNTMTVGDIDPCLTSATANTGTHTHQAHLVVQNVEDLVAFQVRLNYIGDQMRPSTFNPTPFMDSNTGQSVGFINLPIDSVSGVHRGVTPAVTVPPAPVDGTRTPQTALVGAAYNGNQTFPVSPDTPPKAAPDDSSYSAPSGGVVGSLVLQVVGDESGQASLFMDLDDGTPNPPGSRVVVWTGDGASSIDLAESALFDGFHGEGSPCQAIDVSNEVFRNLTFQTANGLHVEFSGAITPRLIQNAPGCASDPTLNGDHATGALDVVWTETCVDAGEEVVIEITSAGVQRLCSDFTLNGTTLGAADGDQSCVLPTTPTPTPLPTPAPSPPPQVGFSPQVSATYCAPGTGDIDQQQLTITCTPDASAGSHADLVGSVGLPLGNYNFGGLVNLSPTAPDDSAIPIGAIVGKVGTQPTLGLLNNPCNNSQLRVPFTMMKGSINISDTVQPQPFGTANDLAILAGDNPPYDGVQDVKPPPAVTQYPSYLNAIFDPDWVDYGADKIAGNGDDNNGPQPPVQPVFRAVGAASIPSAGNLWQIRQELVFAPGTKLPNLPAFDPSLGYPSVVVLQQASASGSATPPAESSITDDCSILLTVSVSYGTTKDNPDTPANEGGIPVRTLPAAGTQITSTFYSFSQRDADGDGFENSIDPCPLNSDAGTWDARDSTPPIEGDTDKFAGLDSPDGIPNSCDPTPDEATGAPPANSPRDHDGDGFPNRGDNCPLVANGKAEGFPQRDSDLNADGEEVGDGIGDACDPNPLTPDGAEIFCIRQGATVVGGDPAVGFSDCLTSFPPPGTPTPTPGPPQPGLFHDAAVKRLRGPTSVRLSPGVADSGTVTIVAGNARGDHADTVGIYLALLPPGGTSNVGGCLPVGVLNLGSITLLPGDYITLKTQPNWQCTNPGAVDGMSWTLKAIADVHGDDFGSCSTLSQAFDGSCNAALLSDDSDDFNSTYTRPLPRVVANSR